ncbi:MAG: hypothetical protein ACPIOQ_39050, partial [Promethearchaeia archaeon]
ASAGKKHRFSRWGSFHRQVSLTDVNSWRRQSHDKDDLSRPDASRPWRCVAPTGVEHGPPRVTNGHIIADTPVPRHELLLCLATRR